MASLTITIVNGEAVVTADGSKTSCDAAREVEKAMGQITKSVPTGESCKPIDMKVGQK